MYGLDEEEERLLYDFDAYEACFLMQEDGRVRVFSTESGKVVPLGISVSDDDDCETLAFAIVVQNGGVSVSSRYYSRFQCSDFSWPEKPFHVLATEVVDLPAESVAFELNY